MALYGSLGPPAPAARAVCPPALSARLHPARVLQDVCHQRTVQSPRKRAVSGEVSIDFAGRRKKNSPRRNTLPDSPAFIGPEEKCLVLLDWSTEGAAELILLEIRNRNTIFVVDEIIRIQDGIPEVFIEIAVDPIGSGLCNHVDN